MDALHRAVAVVLTCISLTALGACTPDRRDAGTLLQAIDASVLRPVLWQEGAASSVVPLLGLVGLDEAGVSASVVTAAPAIRVVAHPEAGPAVAPEGYARVTAEGGVDGDRWRIYLRGDLVEASVGIPAIAIGPGLLVSGDLEEVTATARRVGDGLGDEPLHLPSGTMSGARMALVAGPADPGQAGDPSAPLRPHAGFSLTWTGDEIGTLTLLMDRPEQEDAVALAVRLRNAVVGGGMALSSVMIADGPLATRDRIVVPVRWRGDPETVLRQGLDGGLADVLAPSS